MEGVLCTAGRVCRHAIEAVQGEKLLLEHDDWARARLADFNHWAAGVGLFARSKNSLDYRLRDLPDAIEVLCSLMGSVTAVFQRCLRECDAITQAKAGRGFPLHGVPEIAKEQELPTLLIAAWSSDEESDGGAEDHVKAATLPPTLAEPCKDAENLLDRLVDIGTLIRRSGLSERLLRADQSFNAKSYIDLRQHLETTLYLRQLLTTRSLEASRLWHSSAESASHLAEYAYLRESQIHLVQANLRRRHRFAFARRRASTLGREVVTTASQPLDAVETMPQEVTSSTGDDGQHPIPAREPLPIASQVSASAVDQSFDVKALEVRSGSSAVSSAQSTTANERTYPKPPRLSKQQAFKCPCCCQPLPKRIGANRGRWRKHVARDLYPYTCPVVGCAAEDVLFAKQRDWRSHLSEQHRVVSHWACSICGDGLQYFNQHAFGEHVRVAHSASVIQQYLAAFVSMSQREVVDLPALCPVCSLALATDTSEAMDHLAACIHSFSLLALPWNDGVTEAPSIHASERSVRIRQWLAELTDEGSVQPPESMQVYPPACPFNTALALASAPLLPDDHYFDSSWGSSVVQSSRSKLDSDDVKSATSSLEIRAPGRQNSLDERKPEFSLDGWAWSITVDDPWWPCILAVDGGGVRGYSSLLVLKNLMHEIWLCEKRLEDEQREEERITGDPPASCVTNEEDLLPCHYFDFMFGTSSGGIIATLLGRLRLTVEQSLEFYRFLGENMFGRRRSRVPLATKYYHEPLEAAVKDIVRSCYEEGTFREGIDDLFPLDVDESGDILERAVPFDVDDPRVCHTCCLTATSEGVIDEAYLLRTYPHYYNDTAPNWIARYNEGALEIPIWKVVRATSATPLYFNMVTHVAGGVLKAFKDGGIRENNPSGAAFSEFHALYEGRASEPALLLSVGAGRVQPEKDDFEGRGLFGRFANLSTLRSLMYLQTPRVVQAGKVKYIEGQRQHYHMREAAHGENSWYKRIDVAGIERMQPDEWIKGSYNDLKNFPGGATLTAIEEATDKDLRRPFDKMLDSYAAPGLMLRQTAEKLVRQRRARERLGGPRWTTFVGVGSKIVRGGKGVVDRRSPSQN
ncbi:hypothetical protein LTR91_012604 [Friedmanniomyces endolithicus]|uniref:PNPLA domain-containing protein n=1 Tax=Friedmanniomyces endolithicus TaxID=329885 RepID=A0AAN6QQF9_9PEZI|nr:hypothetical protein LTR94_007783 [Friedmanniomyces endolithicus]KAK0793446.1 hypothetical protein LTR38_009532 [Friedmanniomyces endolithicus]KAK0801897.1 hypothetical protein LTR59_005251 [Friedmanniomyces endolithicus]KAK0817404.1 hypothetical protein LTR75_003143 [Friedmanniomyces endolithicus]KAK0866918.1 hypothetical protein LTS02_004479 [Friedmanniomyces endolithicus]